jgi:alkanesulfonate monooxygenase SsuD/methylene tetrahydromethanopterin reductase-like flavin-dependent oxidoreductase (luciferase family)
MTDPLAFGVFDQMDRNPDLALTDYYEDRLKVAEAYDRASFRSLFVSEHHSTPLGMAPSPGIFFSAVAQRTKRLRFGPLVYTLPLYEPFRLIEEICMLDHLSGGRYEVGVGKGISPWEVGFFGHPFEEAMPRYIEAFEVVIKGLTQPELDHHGKYYTYDKVPMEFAPVQKPHPPIWYGVVNPDTVDWAVANRVNLVAHDTVDKVAEIARRYREAWSTGPNATAPRPHMALGRHIFIADNEAEAHKIAKDAYAVWWDALNYLWKAHGTTSKSYPESYEESVQARRVIVGTPAGVRDEVCKQVAETGVSMFIGRFAFGDMRRQDSDRSIRHFADTVMPAAAEVAQAA